MNRPLFIVDKFCNGNPHFGLSAWEGNIVSSFETSSGIKPGVFHFDENRLNDPSIDHNKSLISQILNYKPDYIFAVVYEDLQEESKTHLSLSSLRHIGVELSIPVVFLFGDLEILPQLRIAERVINLSTLVLYSALSSAGNLLSSKKARYVWVPKDSRYFYSESGRRDIDVCYVGSPTKERMHLLRYLEREGVSVAHFGGERVSNIKVQDYAGILRKSKICLSFSRSFRAHVINARPYEIAACGGLILEQHGLETPRMFSPWDEFIPYFSYRDCRSKIIKLLANQDEIEKISSAATRRYKSYYTATHFWNEVDRYVSESINRRGRGLISVSESLPFPLTNTSVMHDAALHLYVNYPPSTLILYNLMYRIYSDRILFSLYWNLFEFRRYIWWTMLACFTLAFLMGK